MNNLSKERKAIREFLSGYYGLLSLFNDNPEILNGNKQALRLYDEMFKLSFDDLPIAEWCDSLADDN